VQNRAKHAIGKYGKAAAGRVSAPLSSDDCYLLCTMGMRISTGCSVKNKSGVCSAAGQIFAAKPGTDYLQQTAQQCSLQGLVT
jgi:hypothetical protein